MIRAFAIIVITALFCYGAFAFYFWEANAGNWTNEQRQGCLILILIVGIVSAAVDSDGRKD